MRGEGGNWKGEVTVDSTSQQDAKTPGKILFFLMKRKESCTRRGTGGGEIGVRKR